MLKKIKARVSEPTTLLGLLMIAAMVATKIGLFSSDPLTWLGYAFAAFFILNPEK